MSWRPCVSIFVIFIGRLKSTLSHWWWLLCLAHQAPTYRPRLTVPSLASLAVWYLFHIEDAVICAFLIAPLFIPKALLHNAADVKFKAESVKSKAVLVFKYWIRKRHQRRHLNVHCRRGSVLVYRKTSYWRFDTKDRTLHYPAAKDVVLNKGSTMVIPFYTITKSMRALWLVNQLWFIVPVNPRKNRASSELLYKSNRPQVFYGL